ncbi:MAG: DeoR family transcriptional regulator [Candidatus Pacebacteria bacterium]|nr:DeoR family transcriptional regulator [Candidatus Paceibacterota bacterium]
MFERSHVIKLTMVLYKVSDFFPEKEPLKALIRKKADEVLAGLILLEKDSNLAVQVLGDIEIIKAYIELAQNQDWLKSENFEVLKKEYCLINDKIKEQIIFEKNTTSQEQEKKKFVSALPHSIKTNNESEDSRVHLNERHKKIIGILKQGKLIQVKDLKDVFPNISKRTIRRDFEYLFENGLVERVGDNNNTEYKLKSK